MYVCMYVCMDLDVFEKDARVFNILVHDSYFWPPFPHKLTN